MNLGRIGVFGAVPIALLQDDRVNERCIRIYCALMSYEGTDDESYPSIEKIAERAGTSEATAMRATAE